MVAVEFFVGTHGESKSLKYLSILSWSQLSYPFF